jgi:uncharacterized membrane protein YedE/YeeE
MKRVLLYFLIGILFGITMMKSEAASWFRIYEMFQFKSFHMYGIIGAAVCLGVLITQLIKRYKLRSFFGEEIHIAPKPKLVSAPLIGGAIFGLGWALTGACPGPIYVLIGAGYLPLLVVMVFAVLGTYCYGWIKPRLPH